MIFHWLGGGVAMWRALWNDVDGAVFSTELLLISSLLVAGLATGLSSVRNAVSTELNDVASSIQALNQSYAFNGVANPSARTPGSQYLDQPEYAGHYHCVLIENY